MRGQPYSPNIWIQSLDHTKVGSKGPGEPISRTQVGIISVLKMTSSSTVLLSPDYLRPHKDLKR